MGGRQSGRNLVGSLCTRTVSILLLRTIGTSGMWYRFASLSNQPLKIAFLVTMTSVFEALYTLTSLSSNTVMYPASANFAVLISKLVGTNGDYVDISCWLTNVVVEEAHVTCWCSCSIRKLENLGRKFSGGDVGFLCFVLLCSDI